MKFILSEDSNNEGHSHEDGKTCRGNCGSFKCCLVIPLTRLTPSSQGFSRRIGTKVIVILKEPVVNATTHLAFESSMTNITLLQFLFPFFSMIEGMNKHH